MRKLADISVLEGLQRSANESMGCGHLGVFNSQNKAIRNMSPDLSVPNQKGFKFSFFSNEPDRMNIHVEKDGAEAVFWVEQNKQFDKTTVTFKRKSKKFRDSHITEAKKVIIDNLPDIKNKMLEFEKRKEARTSESYQKGGNFEHLSKTQKTTPEKDTGQ